MEEAKRAFGFVCPHCGKIVYAERTQFAMVAGPMDVICECGKSTLHMEADALQRYHLQVPCGVCGGIHNAVCEEKALMTGRGIGLACAKAQQLCCYIGWPEEVRAKVEALADLCAEQKEKAETAEDGEPETFHNDIIMYEVLSELKDIAARGGISCACGSRAWTMKVHHAAVDLICSRCGTALRIPAGSDADLDELCCRMKLEIPGRK
jgi:hypothetical protein